MIEIKSEVLNGTVLHAQSLESWTVDLGCEILEQKPSGNPARGGSTAGSGGLQRPGARCTAHRAQAPTVARIRNAALVAEAGRWSSAGLVDRRAPQLWSYCSWWWCGWLAPGVLRTVSNRQTRYVFRPIQTNFLFFGLHSTRSIGPNLCFETHTMSYMHQMFNFVFHKKSVWFKM